MKVAIDSGGKQFHFLGGADAHAWLQRTANTVLGMLIKYLAISVTLGMLISVAEENGFWHSVRK